MTLCLHRWSDGKQVKRRRGSDAQNAASVARSEAGNAAQWLHVIVKRKWTQKLGGS
jgi:hypothetical protein